MEGPHTIVETLTLHKIETIAEGVTLYLGDCREILPTLPRVDAVVTDPPYGVRDDDWDAMDEYEFALFTMSWLPAARAAAQEMAIFSNYESAIRDCLKMVFPRVRPLIWNKPAGSQLSGAKEASVWYAFETILHCHGREPASVVQPKSLRLAEMIRASREAAGLSRSAIDIAIRGKKTGLCFRWEEAACLPTPEQASALVKILSLGEEFAAALAEAWSQRDTTKRLMADVSSGLAADKTDVFTRRTITGGRHPCEKPVALMVDILSSIGSSWENIVDPFMGSGSTGVACQKVGRRFVGIEQSPKYFDIACSRMSEAIRQPDMFIKKPAPAEQMGLEV